jgi:hypothetical protein
MTTRVKDPSPAPICPSPLVLFGIDGCGKPKAARFGKQHAGLALKAASQLHLNVLTSSDPTVVELASRLPVGRVHATGRAFVPFIRRDLYDKLVAAAANGHGVAGTPANGSPGASGSTPGGSAPRLPKSWLDIGMGDLVVANDSRDEGWYEAIVIHVDGDMLTLRWRDYARERRLVRHRNRLALLYPNAKPMTQTAAQSKPISIKQHGKAAAETSGAGPQALPCDWQAIDLGHLVLVKDDSQWGAWWEAVPVEKAGDSFKLRWRDNYANVPLITRPRLDLALICPDAA